MAQEEHHRCSNSSSDGVRPSRKLKQKKIPQRGLGVAQLEKIRLEEQKKDSHHNHQSSSSIVFSPPSPTDLSSFRPSPPISPSNFDVLSPPAPPIPPATLLYGHNSCDQHDVVGGSAIGASGTAAMVEGQGQGQGQGQRQAYLPTMWNSCELNSEVEGHKLDLGFEYGQHLRNESNPIWPPVLMQRKQEQQQQQHHQPPPSSKVNLSVSRQNFLIEPPSIQSYYSNYTTPLWPEEYKMVGIKRQWPFSLDNPPGSKLNCKFPPLIPPSCGNGGNGAHSFEPKGSIFREGPSSSTSFRHLDWREGLTELNLKKENGALDTILTLGPSSATTTSPSLASKAKQPLELPAYHFQEFQEFNLLPFQGYTEDLVRQGGSIQPAYHFQEFQEFNLLPFQGYTEDLLRQGGSIQQQPFYSFFPSKRHQISTSTATSNEQRCEPEEVMDLTLKL